jgi:hypothetical protein
MGQMGLAHVLWKRRQRDTPGHRDHLVVEIDSPLRAHKNCTPSSGQQELAPSGPAAPAFPVVIPASDRADNGRSPPYACEADRKAAFEAMWEAARRENR